MKTYDLGSSSSSNLPIDLEKILNAEKNLDKLFFEAFTPANHPALIDWVTIKFAIKELKKLKI